MRTLPNEFAVHGTGDGRWFTISPDGQTLQAGRTFDRRELRAGFSGWLLPVPKPGAAGLAHGRKSDADEVELEENR